MPASSPSGDTSFQDGRAHPPVASAHAVLAEAPGYRAARIPLMLLTAFVGVTAAVGGAALILGSVSPSSPLAIVIPPEYLDDSPFTSYLLPGVILALVLGGVHIAACVMLLRRYRWALLWTAAAGFDALIWIFVQMVWIPFSFFHPAYFAIGLAEVGFTLLALGVMRPISAAKGS